MSCASGTLKYALFVFNALWAILGILVIVFGGLGFDAMPQKYAIGIVLLGIVIFTTSFFGCCGALRESARMLWTYATFLLVLLVVIIVFMCVSTPHVFKNYAMRAVDEHWEKELNHPGAMDTIQLTYSCCGRLSAEDYVKIERLPPSSCCKDSNCINPLNLYITGCLKKVEEAFSDEATTTKIYEWGLLCFDLVILILAIILAIHYTNRKRRYSY